jgi:hypothetical protein
MQISRSKPDSLHRTPAGFTVLALDGYGLCDILPARPTSAASYPVSVRRVATLLHASFRQSLAVLPLRFASASPPSGCTGTFTPKLSDMSDTQAARAVRCPRRIPPRCNGPEPPQAGQAHPRTAKQSLPPEEGTQSEATPDVRWISAGSPVPSLPPSSSTQSNREGTAATGETNYCCGA